MITAGRSLIAAAAIGAQALSVRYQTATSNASYFGPSPGLNSFEVQWYGSALHALRERDDEQGGDRQGPAHGVFLK